MQKSQGLCFLEGGVKKRSWVGGALAFRLFCCLYNSGTRHQVPSVLPRGATLVSLDLIKTWLITAVFQLFGCQVFAESEPVKATSETWSAVSILLWFRG